MAQLTENLKEDIAEYLGGDVSYVKQIEADKIEDDIGEYLLYTDREADKAVEENIRDSVWAFNASFLSELTDLPEEVFVGLQDKYESSNEAILKLIQKTCGIDRFVEEAIDTDGRGHFLATYDGDEILIRSDGKDYYLYRVD